MERNNGQTEDSWKPKEKWHGVNLLGMFRKPDDTTDSRARGYFDEDYFMWLHDWGFNFARLPMDYQHFIIGDDKFSMNEEGFSKVDKAVEFGQKYGIHIQLCLHHAPGFSILAIPGEIRDLQENPESQRAFRGLWRAFAERYAGISNDFLSFNPLNEPSGFSIEQLFRCLVMLWKKSTGLIHRDLSCLTAIARHLNPSRISSMSNRLDRRSVVTRLMR